MALETVTAPDGLMVKGVPLVRMLYVSWPASAASTSEPTIVPTATPTAEFSVTDITVVGGRDGASFTSTTVTTAVHTEPTFNPEVTLTVREKVARASKLMFEATVSWPVTALRVKAASTLPARIAYDSA